jgi:hypothetical protein
MVKTIRKSGERMRAPVLPPEVVDRLRVVVSKTFGTLLADIPSGVDGVTSAESTLFVCLPHGSDRPGNLVIDAKHRLPAVARITGPPFEQRLPSSQERYSRHLEKANGGDYGGRAGTAFATAATRSRKW